MGNASSRLGNGVAIQEKWLPIGPSGFPIKNNRVRKQTRARKETEMSNKSKERKRPDLSTLEGNIAFIEEQDRRKRNKQKQEERLAKIQEASDHDDDEEPREYLTKYRDRAQERRDKEAKQLSTSEANQWTINLEEEQEEDFRPPVKGLDYSLLNKTLQWAPLETEQETSKHIWANINKEKEQTSDKDTKIALSTLAAFAVKEFYMSQEGHYRVGHRVHSFYPARMYYVYELSENETNIPLVIQYQEQHSLEYIQYDWNSDIVSQLWKNNNKEETSNILPSVGNSSNGILSLQWDLDNTPSHLEPMMENKEQSMPTRQQTEEMNDFNSSNLSNNTQLECIENKKTSWSLLEETSDDENFIFPPQVVNKTSST